MKTSFYPIKVVIKIKLDLAKNDLIKEVQQHFGKQINNKTIKEISKSISDVYLKHCDSTKGFDCELYVYLIMLIEELNKSNWKDFKIRFEIQK